jgi:hypothetical protein
VQAGTPVARGSPTMRMLAHYVALSLTVAGSVSVARASELSDVAAAMPPGSWAEITNMASWNQGSFLSPAEFGCNDGDYITQFSEKAAWDPVHQRLLFVGQTHGSCYGGLFVIYDEGPNAWSKGPWVPGHCQSGTADEPCFGHGYGHSTADPATGTFYYRHSYSTDFYRFDTSWTQLPTPMLQSSQCCGALEFFPERGLVFVDSDWGIHEYDPAGDAWTQLANTSAPDAVPGLPNLPMPVSNFAQYNAVTHALLLGGGDNLYLLDPQGAFTTKAAPPVALGVTQAVTSADPVTGAYIVLSGEQMYQYDAAADAWTALATPIPSQLTALEGVDDGLIATPIPAYGVILYVKYAFNNSAVMLYKHAAPPPCDSDDDCLGSGPCQSATCDVSTGICQLAPAADGTPCPGGTCVDGACTTGEGGGSGVGGNGPGPSATNGSGASTAGGPGAGGNGLGGGAADGSDGGDGCDCALATPARPNSGIALLLGLSLFGLRRRRRYGRVIAGATAVALAIAAVGCDGADGTSDDGIEGTGAGSVSAGPGGPSAAQSTTSAAQTTGTGGSGPIDPADFETRCAAPGVVRCVGFDSPSDLGGEWGNAPTGILPGETTPELDTAQKASGPSSLKFTVPSSSGADSSGSYFANFSDDLSVQFDAGDEFYVAWRQRFDPVFATAAFEGAGGWKQAIVGEGSRPGDPVASCTPLEIVPFNGYQAGFPRLYHSCGSKDGQYEPMSPPTGSSDFALQNAVPGCLYSSPSVPPCVGYVPDEWMTFKMRVKIGTWYQNDGVYHHDSIVELWVAREGQPSTLVIDMSPGDPACAEEETSLPSCKTGYDLVNDAIGIAKYGQVWLLPYNTDKDPNVTYPETYTWYDELIVSTQPIADPI